MAASKPADEPIASTAAFPVLNPSSERRLGEFILLRSLGKGGMAEVWLAEQTSLKRNVALKLLKPELMSDPNYVKRFQAEAKAAGGLSHPNIVQVYSIGQADGQHFIAQEYVQGATLKSFLQKRGALDTQTAMHIMRQVASALQAAAERGIVHRDIKPENIMLTRKGEVKVADFGLAQLMGGERLNLTQEGTTMGTPLYMSPEQVNGGKLDQRSDIYSFGVTCYHMLAGDTPFRGETAIAVAMQHLNNNPADLALKRTDIPKPLIGIIHRMLEKNPDLRYPGAREVLADLKKVARSLKDSGDADSVELQVFESPETGPSLAARRPWLVLSLLSILVAAASAGLGWWQRPLTPDSTRRENIPRLASAEDQFYDALMHVDSEDRFRAVKDYFPEETLYGQLADEQLTLLVLKDVQNPNRQDAINKQINALLARASQVQVFGQEAAIARAYVQAHWNEVDKASQTLTANSLMDGTPPETIQGTWIRLLSDARDAVNRRRASGRSLGAVPNAQAGGSQRNPASPPANGPTPFGGSTSTSAGPASGSSAGSNP